MQPKNAKFPTDANLLYTAIIALGACARGAGVNLRQSYVRVGKRAQIKTQRYAHAKQWRCHRPEVKFLKTRLRRIIRDSKRKASGDPALREIFAERLAKARTINAQVLNRRADKELYS